MYVLTKSEKDAQSVVESLEKDAASNTTVLFNELVAQLSTIKDSLSDPRFRNNPSTSMPLITSIVNRFSMDYELQQYVVALKVSEEVASFVPVAPTNN